METLTDALSDGQVALAAFVGLAFVALPLFLVAFGAIPRRLRIYEVVRLWDEKTVSRHVSLTRALARVEELESSKSRRPCPRYDVRKLPR